MQDGKPIPVGEPVQDYYPAVMKTADWYRLQSVCDSRKKMTGRGRVGEMPNLFGKILRSGSDGSRMEYRDSGNGQKIVASVASANGLTNISNRFDYPILERAFLTWVSEIRLNESNREASAVDELQGKSEEIRKRIEQIKTRIAESNPEDCRHFLDVLQTLSRKEKELSALLQTEKAKAHRPDVSTEDIRTLIEECEKMPAEARKQIRMRLRAAIQSLIQEIRLSVFSKSRKCKIAIVEVHFRDDSRRMLIIRTAYREQAYTYSDDHVWSGEPTLPDTDLLLSADSPRECFELLEASYPWEMKMSNIHGKRQDNAHLLADPYTLATSAGASSRVLETAKK
jgi:hypothetical protein